MLTEREVLSTINMLRSEHLDVRTVTLGINLFDCASHDFDVFELKVRSKILKYAKRLVETCNSVGDRYGIPVVNKRIAVSAIGTVCAGFTTEQMVRVCRILDDCAKEVGVDFVGGFGALVEKGMTPGERNLINALPEALATTDRICSSINVGSTKSGINMDAVSLMGRTIVETANATADRDGIGCAKLVVFCNIPQDVPFMAGAYLGVGEPDVVIDVGVSGPGVVNKALQRAIEETGRKLTLYRGVAKVEMHITARDREFLMGDRQLTSAFIVANNVRTSVGLTSYDDFLPQAPGAAGNTPDYSQYTLVAAHDQTAADGEEMVLTAYMLPTKTKFALRCYYHFNVGVEYNRSYNYQLSVANTSSAETATGVIAPDVQDDVFYLRRNHKYVFRGDMSTIILGTELD